MSAPVVCTIGTSDPWNAAGIGLDVLALHECGAYPVCVTVGTSAQNAAGIALARPVAPELVVAQFDALADAGIAAYRIGAMLDATTVALVASRVSRSGVPIVYDPALGASGGGRFGDDATLDSIRERLVPIVTIVTPNLAEAAALAGFPVDDRDAMEAAARALVARGARAALVKGGHLAGDPSDVLVDASGTRAFSAERLSGSLRGTGCLLAASLAAALARGDALDAAVAVARAFVRDKIVRGTDRGGMRTAY